MSKNKIENFATVKDKKIKENISIIDNSKKYYLENIRQIQFYYICLMLLFVLSFIIFCFGAYKVYLYQQAGQVFIGNVLFFHDSSILIIITVGFSLSVVGLIIFFILKLRLREISKYLYSIERLNLLKIALNMVADYQEANTVVKYDEDVRIKTIEKLLDLVKNMDGFGINTF